MIGLVVGIVSSPHMAATELARMISAANTVLDEAASAIGLSKRAALALAIMSQEGREGGSLSNQELQDRFVQHRISSELSAKKDASAAKGELLKAKHIEIQGRVAVFAMTEHGKVTLERMYDVMTQVIDGIGLDDEERLFLRQLVGAQQKRSSDGQSPLVPTAMKKANEAVPRRGSK